MRRSVGEELGNHEKVFGTVRAIEWNEVLHGQIRHRGCHSGYVFLYIVKQPPLRYLSSDCFFLLCLWAYLQERNEPEYIQEEEKSFPRAGTVFDPLAKTSET